MAGRAKLGFWFLGRRVGIEVGIEEDDCEGAGGGGGGGEDEFWFDMVGGYRSEVCEGVIEDVTKRSFRYMSDCFGSE